jgi:drug/metabolite transporter (DMT)-like permease
MSTPVKRPDATPAVPAAPAAPLEPVQVVKPFGWLLIVAAGVGMILATWLVYGVEADGMWAGYRDGFTATVVLACAMALNTTVPKRPFLGIIALAGILLILFAVFLENSTAVFVSELVGGALMLVGAICYGAGDR